MGQYMFKAPNGVIAVYSTYTDEVLGASRDLEAVRQGLRKVAIAKAGADFDNRWPGRVTTLEETGTDSYMGNGFEAAVNSNHHTGPDGQRLNREEFLALLDKMARE